MKPPDGWLTLRHAPPSERTPPPSLTTAPSSSSGSPSPILPPISLPESENKVDAHLDPFSDTAYPSTSDDGMIYPPSARGDRSGPLDTTAGDMLPKEPYSLTRALEAALIAALCDSAAKDATIQGLQADNARLLDECEELQARAERAEQWILKFKRIHASYSKALRQGATSLLDVIYEGMGLPDMPRELDEPCRVHS